MAFLRLVLTGLGRALTGRPPSPARLKRLSDSPAPANPAANPGDPASIAQDTAPTRPSPDTNEALAAFKRDLRLATAKPGTPQWP